MKGPEVVIERIGHMREAIEELRRVTEEGSSLSPAGNWMVMRGIERAFEIISEASRHIPEALKAGEPQIAWRDIADIGNFIRHEYSKVSLEILLRTIDENLPDLDAALLRILDWLERG